MKKYLLLAIVLGSTLRSYSAMQSIAADLIIPSPPTEAAGTPSGTGFALDALDEKGGNISMLSRDTCISAIKWRVGSVSTGGTFTGQIETVNTANGLPSGTLWDVDTTTVTTAAASNAWYTSSLTAGATIPANTPFAFVIIRSGVVGNINFASFGNGDYATEYSYVVSSIGASGYTKVRSQASTIMTDCSGAIVTSGLTAPWSGAVETFASNSNPNYRGLYFKLNVPAAFTGWWAWTDPDGPGRYILYDSDGTSELASVVASSVTVIANTAGITVLKSTVAVVLAKDTYYRAVFAPTSTTNSSFYSFDVNAAADMAAISGGTNFTWTQSTGTIAAPTSEASWAQTSTKRPYIGVLLGSFDDGAGGGGGTKGFTYAQ